MDWKECNIKKLVKKIGVDNNLIKSLVKSSQNKLESANRLKIDETTSSSVISLCYESLRELLEALATKKGFKIYNHECYTALLKEVLGQEELSIRFDRFRKIRNKVNYYGKDIGIEETSSVKEEIIESINKIKQLLQNKGQGSPNK
ncbi:hypothetical protein AYK26_00095 [Euryarchaeota archaeon SM23-78]|nr:MAG: hypothetical protein AYK26_00095 [Euryarchaeota archaeon SM23-78]MBW3000522.1 hypothetical protein [Candidatus Woesearchaeota archaeon]